MDLKKLVMMLFGIIFGAILFLTSFQFIFHKDDNGNPGFLVRTGTTAVANDFSEAETETTDMMKVIQTTAAPEVKYTGGTQYVNQKVFIKTLISVKSAGSSNFVSGTNGTDFDVIVYDVKDQNGKSINPITEDAGNDTEEIVSAAYYNQKECSVIFNERGVFRICVRVVGANGRYTEKELKVPVEE